MTDKTSTRRFGFQASLLGALLVGVLWGLGSLENAQDKGAVPDKVQAASPVKQVKELERRENGSLTLAVLVPPQFTSREFKEIGEHFRLQHRNRQKVEINMWDDEQAYRRFADWKRGKVDEDRRVVSSKEFVRTVNHNRAKYLKDLKRKTHRLTIWRTVRKETEIQGAEEIVTYSGHREP